MKKSGELIRERRQALGLTLREVGEQIGASVMQVSMLERGERRMSTDWLEKIASALQCNVTDLLTDAAPLDTMVDLVGYIGAEAMYYPDPKHGPWQAFKQVPGPPGLRGMVALQVTGESLSPRYGDGDVLYFERKQTFDIDVCAGHDCVVQLRSGAAYIRYAIRDDDTLRYVTYDGQEPGDTDVAWAQPVIWVRRAPRL